MEIDAITAFITGALEGVDVLAVDGDVYFVFDPSHDLPPDRRRPFATIVTSNAHDRASDLDRPGVFRLNIGISRETYEDMFGPPPPGPIAGDPIDTGHDYTRLDVLMPHPVYASLAWVCVLNPGAETFDEVAALLREAHGLAVARRQRPDAPHGAE